MRREIKKCVGVLKRNSKLMVAHNYKRTVICAERSNIKRLIGIYPNHLQFIT